MKSSTVAFGVVLGLVFGFSARADMTWEVRTDTTLKVGSETRALPVTSTTFSVKANVLRMDTGTDQPTQFINAENNAVVIVNYPTETFLLLDFSQMVASQASEREQLKAKLPLMEVTLAQLPPEQRPEQQALLEAQKRKYELWGQPYSVRATAERAVVEGHQCIKYEGMSSGQVFQEIWVAQDITPDPNYYSQLAPRLAELDAQEYSIPPRVRGLPVRVVSSYGPVTVTETLTRYTNATIPADAFIIPDNFRETEAASKRNQ